METGRFRNQGLRRVGLGVEMARFRDQRVETGRFRNQGVETGRFGGGDG